MPKGLIAIEGPATPSAAPWAPMEAALLPVANRPLVLHAADTLRRAGAGQVLVVAAVGAADAIREAIGDEAEGLEFVELPEAPTAATAILAVAGALEGERFLVHVGDGLLVRDHGTLRAALADEATDATVFFHAERGAGAPASRFSPGPRWEDPQDEHRLAGVHAFGPAFLDALRSTPAGEDGRFRLADVVEHLAAAGGRVQGGVLEDWWRHRGTPDDLLDVNRRVLDLLPPTGDTSSQNLAETRVEGRVVIHPTAVVRNAVIRGPAIIGAHARVTDACVGPYTSIGAGATIENAEIASSVVLPRARIRHVGVRVEDSIVGAGASIGRDFALPKAMRLLVGRDAQITLG